MRFLLLALALPLAACTAKTTPPDAPKPPHAIGMANPASVYCLEKGGEQIPVDNGNKTAIHFSLGLFLASPWLPLP